MKFYRSLYLRWVGATTLAHVVALLLAIPFEIPLSDGIALGATGVLQYVFVLAHVPGARHRYVWPLVHILAAIIGSTVYLIARHDGTLSDFGVILDIGLFLVLTEAAVAIIFGIFSRFVWMGSLILCMYLLFILDQSGIRVSAGIGSFDISSLIAMLIRGAVFGITTGLALILVLHAKDRALKARMFAMDRLSSQPSPGEIESTG